MLYPLKFNPLFEERIWFGDQLRRKRDKKLATYPSSATAYWPATTSKS